MAVADGATVTAVAVLYARRDSIYKLDPRCDVYDIDRDARTFPGDRPVIAHPPCRSWGSFRNFAKPAPGEKDLGLLAVQQVRENFGVLEHPALSTLWPAAGLPRPGDRQDKFGGWTLAVDQDWFGHRAQKRTFLYIVGADPRDIPAFPLSLDIPPRVMTNRKGLRSGMEGYRPEVTEPEREATPPLFASWLVDLVQGMPA